MTKVTKTIVDKLNKNVKAKDSIPKFILLDIATEACALLSGVACGALDPESKEYKAQVLEVTRKMCSILDRINNSDEIQQELRAEEDCMMQSIAKGLSDEEKIIVLNDYEEHLKDIGEDTSSINNLKDRLFNEPDTQ